MALTCFPLFAVPTGVVVVQDSKGEVLLLWMPVFIYASLSKQINSIFSFLSAAPESGWLRDGDLRAVLLNGLPALGWAWDVFGLAVVAEGIANEATAHGLDLFDPDAQSTIWASMGKLLIPMLLGRGESGPI